MQILPSYATRPAADGAGAEKYQTLLGTEGDWTLECGVDITSTRGAVKNAEPQVLTLGESKLDLKNSAFPAGRPSPLWMNTSPAASVKAMSCKKGWLYFIGTIRRAGQRGKIGCIDAPVRLDRW